MTQVVEYQGGYVPQLVGPDWRDSAAGGLHSPGAPSQLPLTRVIESSEGPWNQAGAYGRQNEFIFPTTLNSEPIAIFSNDRQMGPPRARTLNLFRNDSELSVAVSNADLYALITYGVGGVQNQFLCDWSRGGQFSLVLETLRVEAVPYLPQLAVPYLPPQGRQLLGCMLSHEGPSVARPITFTTSEAAVASGGSVSFAVPDFARWVYPTNIVLPAQPSTDTVEFLNQGVTTLKLVRLDDALLLRGTPVPGGTSVITVHNNSGGFRAYGLQFELGL